MAVPLFLSPQAFEPSPPGVAKNSRHIFTVACAIRVATGSLSFVAGDMIWGIWQLLTAFFAFGILRRTTASAVLLIASLFGVELLLSVINLIEMVRHRVMFLPSIYLNISRFRFLNSHMEIPH